MAENNVEPEPEWSDWALDTAEDTLVAIETLLATLRAFEDVLRQQDLSISSSTEYCDNFCQALMHYAGSRNSMEHGLPLLEVYCLSINCFAAARSHLTAESDRVALVLKRLALSCFELLLSVPENEIPSEAWLQFHHSVQIAHDTLLQYGSTDLQALLQITGEGGAWSNPVLTSLLTGQITNLEEVNAYISLEGEGFMEMRVKRLEKMGEVAKAVVLAKACTECSFISNQSMFCQMYISLLCQLLPNEEAILEISRLDCKDVLEITSNMETEGEENTAFILCTTFLTQQLQQQGLYCSWELTLLWSKLQRRLDPSLVSLLERCLQLGAIAKTVHHLLYLVRVIQTEAVVLGTSASVELCVKALQLPKQDDSEARISVCKTVSCLLQNDLEVLRALQLTEFLLGPSQESFRELKVLHLCPDHKYEQESETIPNSLRCELLLALKAYWPFDPEFWDWKTLKNHCSSLLGLKPESEGEEEETSDKREKVKLQGVPIQKEVELRNKVNGGLNVEEQKDKDQSAKQTKVKEESQSTKPKFCCQICGKAVSDAQILHHSKRHAGENHPCPVCKEKFKNRKDLVSHLERHIESELRPGLVKAKTEDIHKRMDEDDDIEPGEITIDPSLMLYYKSTHDPDVLHHIVEQANTVKEKHVDDDEHITFEYINRHFKLQNRDEYPCPGTGCTRIFKHSKYLYVHLKSEHRGDDNVKFFHQMRDKREKCVFCRRHFVSAYHHRKHRRVHYGEQPYRCVVIGCDAQFSSSNELVSHKQTHGCHLDYQCELKGCYISYSDLGQIYHHEAQHFRDAAFTCTSSQCKEYYLSKKEFIKHLATHNISFSESDFEAQRKAKRKLHKVGSEVTGRSKLADSDDANGDLNSASYDTVMEKTDATEPRATMTLVAVCFDGSKFTCGFEKCGMTFSRARDVQRHLKCAHPEHLKLENKEHKHDKEQDFKSKLMNKPQPHKGQNDLSTSLQLGEAYQEGRANTPSKSNETSFPSVTTNDPLSEILIGLSRLNLNFSSPQGLSNASHSDSDASHVALHQAIMAKPPVVLLQKRPQVPVRALVEVNKGSSLELLANAKPYVCQAKNCGFRTAQSYSLLRHYRTKHGRTVEQAKRMTSLKTTSFKPYMCQLCSKSHRQKNVLRAHYIQIHKLSETSVDSMICSSVQHEDDEKVRTQRGETPQLSTAHGLRGKFSKLQPQYGTKNSARVSENEQKFDNPLSEEEMVDQGESRDKSNEQKEKEEKDTKVRTRRLVAKGNLCYILNKFSKPFHCVAKNCDAAFSTQGGLVRHLQLIHHYNRSQLLFEKEIDVPQSSDVKKELGRKRPPSTDEPQPQYKCHFANCSASYHLKSSLVRHTRDCHSQSPELIKCKYDGCTRVFSHNDALKKHTLYTHCEYYDSLVVRLQSTHKKSITGCQKKLIIQPQSPQKEEVGSPTTRAEQLSPLPERTAESGEMTHNALQVEKVLCHKTKERKKFFNCFAFRSHEEALQMCQDRCLRVAFPCMVQDCDSVVSYTHSLNRHYLKVHRMRREDLLQNEDKLIFNAEQLEELIQRKSARPNIIGTCALNGAHNMEYQADSEKDRQSSSRSLNSWTQVETQDGKVETQDGKVETQDGKMETRDGKVETRDGKMETQDGRVETQDGKVETQDGRVETQDGRVETQDGRVETRDGRGETRDEDNQSQQGLPEEEKKDLSSVEMNKVLGGAEEMLHSEPSTDGLTEDSTTQTKNTHQQEERLSLDQIKPLLRKVTVDLSPPCSLRLTPEGGFQDASSNKDDGKRLNRSVSLLTASIRQPLKWKNKLSEQPSNLKDTPSRSHSPRPFNIASYKPIGFESSFLQFIQDTTPKEEIVPPPKRRESFRRSCSVKENNQLGISRTRSRRAHSPLLNHHALNGDCSSVQNLKSILDKALAGCGDLAIKQLQYLKPVVVLGPPVCTTTLPDLFPANNTNSKVFLGN